MIVVKLMGGLGNQMFQYAAGLRLARRHNSELKFDLTFLLDRSPKEDFIFRDFDLSIFGIPELVVAPGEVRKFRRLNERASRSFIEKVEDKFTRLNYHRETQLNFQLEVLDLPDNTYLDGYFQNELYFADIEHLVRDSFDLSEKVELSGLSRELAELILSTPNATCLNVRRADYVTSASANNYHGICDIVYFQNAIDFLVSSVCNGPIFIFSDDIEWCREKFGQNKETSIVGHEHAGPKFSTYLWLMTLCQNFIIPNSSFAWWAAWLGKHPEKVVVRPSQWFRAEKADGSEICPASWVAVPNE